MLDSEFILDLVGITVFWESFWLFMYLMIYIISVCVVSGIREYRQKRNGVFRLVSELPLEEQIIRVFGSVIIFIPSLIWLLWYSEIIFLSLYLWVCYFLEMTPQLPIPILIRIVVIVAFCAESVRGVVRVKHSHLRRGKLEESIIEPVKEKIITERVFIICPYCGTKTEQGIMKCRNCGAEL